MRFAQIVVGPAGTGKSTYCAFMEKHSQTAGMGRVVRVVNLDPAAEEFGYEPLADVRDLISVEDVMEAEDMQLGPNGALIYCWNYLLENMEWLHDQIGQEYNDDYILFDLPGQIELYTHMDLVRRFIDIIESWDFRSIGVFTMDANFLTDGTKFIAGTLAALSTMVNMEIPHINLITKMDLVSKKEKQMLEQFLEPDAEEILSNIKETKWNKKYLKLTHGIAQVLDQFGLVKYFPLDVTKEDQLQSLFTMIDVVLGISEDDEVKVKDDPEEMEDDDDV